MAPHLDTDAFSPSWDFAVQSPPTQPAPVPTRTLQFDRPLSGAKKLRMLLEETNELIVCPGVYDGLSARTAIEVGFNGLYMVSYRYTLPQSSLC